MARLSLSEIDQWVHFRKDLTNIQGSPTMKYFEHPAYDDSIRTAVDRAKRSPGDCFSVYFDGTAIFVRASEAAKPPESTLICIAQRWNDKSVQLRFTGGHSEFIPI